MDEYSRCINWYSMREQVHLLWKWTNIAFMFQFCTLCYLENLMNKRRTCSTLDETFYDDLSFTWCRFEIGRASA